MAAPDCFNSPSLLVLQAPWKHAQAYAGEPQVLPQKAWSLQWALMSSMHAPQAFSNTLKRMLEAAGRGLWQADAATLDKLQSMYAEIGDELEGVR